jgi:hypothetical protein
MPRRCLCTQLRQRIATDARLATLPMAAKWLWLSLAERAAETPDGQVSLGSAFGFFAGIAMLIQVAEPEVETHWETLAARGLVQRQGDAFTVPDLPATGTRAAVSRANGGFGGRPRRGESPEAARLRRAQAHMMLPVQGGAAKPSETQDENPTTTTESRESVSSGAEKPRRDTAHAVLGAEIASLAGLDPIRQRFDYQPVRAWLDAGHSPALIRSVVAEVTARPSFNAAKVNTLAYFTPIIEQARAEAAPPTPRAQESGTLSPKAQAITAWLARGGDWEDRPRFEAAA